MSTAAANEEVQATEINTSQLKSFAQAARRQLLEQVEGRLQQVLAEGSLPRRENESAVEELEKQIAAASRQQVIERVAYTWFNRFCALRFMDANRYTTLGTVSPAEGYSQPEILADAKQGVIDADWGVDQAQVLGLLDGSLPSTSPEQEAYRLLLVAVCNRFHAYMPFMFEKIADYTELLLPGDLLSENSVLTQTCQVLSVDACQNVEVIGWLYQFYISEKKDEVFAALKKGKKITPQNIPAATQLFTPHWIVRYLVENSLGRLWMLNHPDSKLIEQMDYYIKPEEPETDFLKISSPEEIKVCDPACGSGHMLTYAFDLLYAIYQEQGYTASDIPRLILTHNLYGIEIDGRAGALAAFALTMKARDKYRRFLTGGKTVQPNICVLENISIDPEDLEAYMDKIGRDLFSEGLVGVVNQWEEANNFGSLIRPLVQNVSTLLDILDDHNLGNDLFHFSTHEKVLTALRQADYLSAKYHVVVANPPYMGNKGMNASLKSYLKKHYPTAKSDLYTAFINCFLEDLIPQGFAGVMSPITWMFIGTYKNFRSIVLEKSHFTTLVQPEYHSFFDSAFVPICTFVLRQGAAKSRNGVFINLQKHYGADLQEIKCCEAIADESCEWRYSASTEDFQKIPNSPILYWASKASLDVFDRNSSMAEQVNAKNGITTGDNEIFLRSWHEVAKDNISFDSPSRDEALASGKRWFPNNKGGQFRKWWGNHDYVLDWSNDGQELKDFPKSTVRNIDYFFKESVSWSDVNMKTISFRMYPKGFCFDAAVNSAFPESRELSLRLLSATNNKFVFQMAPILNPTMHFKIGDFGALPGLLRDDGDVTADVERMIEIAKEDWDSFETSWAFEKNELISAYDDSPLDSCFHRVVENSVSIVQELRDLEQKNNRYYISAYGLEDELSPDIPVEEITLTRNPRYRYDSDKSESELEALLLADTMRELVSYAVGCMLGRYSLDQPGLILANAGETIDDYLAQIPEPTFMPDDDNVIPLLDGEWFTDDITGRLKEFLKVTFGTDNYEENLRFLENSLYPENLTGKKRKTIRDYFLKEFYNHHIKTYKKRPIYWLFSSPKGTFNALVYLHRYRSDTVSVVLSYLRDFQAKLTAQMEHLQRVADSGGSSQKEKAKALKEINNLKKELKEIEDYERDTLYPLATAQVELDLDDGVKVNYNKLGKALKKVTGLSGK